MVTDKTAGWHLAAKTIEIDEDEPNDVRIGNLFLAIYKINDRYYATDDICTHEFASLSQGYVDGDVEQQRGGSSRRSRNGNGEGAEGRNESPVQ